MKKLVLLFILALSLIIAYQAYLLRENKIDSTPDIALESIKETVTEQSKDVRNMVLDKTKTVVSKINDKLQNTTKTDDEK